MAAGDITALLRQAAEGDGLAEERLLRQLYGELRRMAAQHLRRERQGHTLQPTELLNEVYVRVMRAKTPHHWNDRVHFFAVASTAMRRVLVDHARRRKSAKRGEGTELEELHETHLAVQHSPERILDIDAALSVLSGKEPRQAKVVELRFFCGLADEEIASVLGVSLRTVKRDWAAAKTWLYQRLADTSIQP
jgi:RNA polymerase sigma factor (TIGR02999 family)